MEVYDYDDDNDDDYVHDDDNDHDGDDHDNNGDDNDDYDDDDVDHDDHDDHDDHHNHDDDGVPGGEAEYSAHCLRLLWAEVRPQGGQQRPQHLPDHLTDSCQSCLVLSCLVFDNVVVFVLYK